MKFKELYDYLLFTVDFKILVFDEAGRLIYTSVLINPYEVACDNVDVDVLKYFNYDLRFINQKECFLEIGVICYERKSTE